nr:hypothetical protein Iba_chr11dCG9350 [Ipomoea batatas]
MAESFAEQAPFFSITQMRFSASLQVYPFHSQEGNTWELLAVPTFHPYGFAVITLSALTSVSIHMIISSKFPPLRLRTLSALTDAAIATASPPQTEAAAAAATDGGSRCRRDRRSMQEKQSLVATLENSRTTNLAASQGRRFAAGVRCPSDRLEE